MSSDPRYDVLYGEIGNCSWDHNTGGILDAIDAVDPLRLALREPSDELIEDVRRLAEGRSVMRPSRYHPTAIRAILDAFAKAVTPDGK
jgi:hypothetical protein